MKRKAVQNLRFYLVFSVLIVSVFGGILLSSTNTLNMQSTNSSNDEANNKPLTKFAPGSYDTPGYVFIDDFSGAWPGYWVENLWASGKAEFKTSQVPGWLMVHTPSSIGPFKQDSSTDHGAYAYVDLLGKLASMNTFTLDTRVNFSKSGPARTYHVGLMIEFQDSYHMYFWGLSYKIQKPNSGTVIQLSSSEQALFTDPFSPTSCYLRIIKNQTFYYFYVALDGASWVYKTSRNATFDGNLGSPTRVGVIVRTWEDSGHANKWPEVWGYFDYFKVTVEGEVYQASYPSTRYCEETATIIGFMRFNQGKAPVASGKMGLIIDGSLDQVKDTDATGKATFTKSFDSSGTHTFTLYAVNTTQYSLLSILNQTFSITWIGYKLRVRVLDMDGKGIPDAVVRLQNATSKLDVKTPQTTNATGYCDFLGVPPSVPPDYLVNVTLNIFGSTTIMNDTVAFGITGDTYRETTLHTTQTFIHVVDSGGRNYQDANITLFQTAAPYDRITSKIVNLTAWASFYLNSSDNYNMSVWYGEPLAILKIKTVNGTILSGPLGESWYTFTASHGHLFNVTAGGAAKLPTYLLLATNTVTVCYWDGALFFNVSLSQDEFLNNPIQASFITCTVGSFTGSFTGNTGNYTISIPASAVGGILLGRDYAQFALSIDATPSDSSTYSRPSTKIVLITIRAIPLRYDCSDSARAYWGHEATLWIRLLDNRTLNAFDGASFSVNIDGKSTSLALAGKGGGNYTMASADAFGLDLGAHMIQIFLAINNYTFVEGSDAIQMVLMSLTVEFIITDTPEVHSIMYDELGLLREGFTDVYWNWAFEFNITYINGVDKSPVEDAAVYIRFYKSTIFVIESAAYYNSTVGAYFVSFDTRVFGGSGIYTYSVTASKAGYVPKTVLSHIIISWRPILVQFSSDSYLSLKGAFGGDSSTQVEVTLRDELSGSLLTGANVSYSWAYGQGNFTEVDTGVYRADIYASQEVPVSVFDVTVRANKTYYEEPPTSVKMTIDFTGGHVQLPIIGIVPTTLFAIILGSVAVVGSLSGFRAYVWITTPYMVKQINKVLHTVGRGTQAERITGLKTRVETSISLLLPELESFGITGPIVPTAQEEVIDEEATVEEDSGKDKEQALPDSADKDRAPKTSEKQQTSKEEPTIEENKHKEGGS